MISADEEVQFFEFYAKTATPLFRKAYRMCRGHEADAQDALQRAYLKVLGNWATVSSLTDSQRHGWIATTLTNEVLQMWRQPYRNKETGSHDDAREVTDAVKADDSDLADDKDRLHQVCRAIARIEGRPSEVMALHGLAGYEISEVAEILGITTATVRVHLHTARVRLRAIMGGEEGIDRDRV